MLGGAREWQLLRRALELGGLSTTQIGALPLQETRLVLVDVRLYELDGGRGGCWSVLVPGGQPLGTGDKAAAGGDEP